MVRRLSVLTVVSICVALSPAAPAVAESTSDRIAKQRAEVHAKIACARAEAQGRSCGPATASTATSRSRATGSPSQAGGSQSSRGGKWLEISISEQVLRAYEGDRLFMSTPVSTGTRGKETPTGRFSILSKTERHWSTQYHVWMPYAMRVVRGIFIHELPVTSDGRRLGTSSLGRPVSAGCIRVGIGDAERLYRWTRVGTPVVIR